MQKRKGGHSRTVEWDEAAVMEEMAAVLHVSVSTWTPAASGLRHPEHTS